MDIKNYHFDSSANDCQQWVCEHYPQVANLLGWLLEYAPSRMTGTGASVFARFDNPSHAEATLAMLPSQFSGFVAKGVNLSPLHQQLTTLSGTFSW
jgi:4-diphosphocytidyl-2-C-methyl-D-erythritol kinase